MALGNPFAPNANGVVLSNVNTSAAANTTFLAPVGSDVWVVNFNSAGVAFVTLSIGGQTNTVASAANGAAVPPNVGMMLKAPWPAGFTGAAQISALNLAGSNTGTVTANAGFGTNP